MYVFQRTFVINAVVLMGVLCFLGQQVLVSEIHFDLHFFI